MKQKEQQNKMTEGKKEKKHWPIVLLAILVILGVVIYFIIQWLDRPGIGVIHVQELKQEINTETKQEKEHFEGKYVSFARFSSYVKKNHVIETETDRRILESAFFAEGGVISKKIAVTVENGAVGDSSSYTFRKINSKDYAEDKLKVGNNEFAVFSAKEAGSFEKVVFVQHGRLMATIALTVGSPESPELNKELENIVESLKWKD